nr:unnamed protein product [Callosobruchus analis]
MVKDVKNNYYMRLLANTSCPDKQKVVWNIVNKKSGKKLIGKTQTGKFTEQVLELIKKSPALKNSEEFKNISVSYDRTPRQMQLYKVVRKQIDDTKNGGESNIRIKYVNGIPKIYIAVNYLYQPLVFIGNIGLQPRQVYPKEVEY